jgi:hypothetical protein
MIWDLEMGIDLDADLVPGAGAAGYAVGQPIESVLEFAAPESVEQRIGVRVLKFGPVWVFEREGRITQICVFAGYHGRLADTIGVGSFVSEVEAAFGSVEDLEWDEYGVPGMPGWCFAVKRGSPAMGEPGWASVRLDCICISGAN